MSLEYWMRVVLVVGQSAAGALWFYTANRHLLRGGSR